MVPLIAAVVAAAPSAALAVCESGEWDMSGNWTFTQTNGYVPSFQIEQKRGVLVGRGQYMNTQFYEEDDGLFDGAEFHVTYRSNLDGVIKGNTFEFTIRWSDTSAGVYTGVIDGNGFVGGSVYDQMSPANKAGWNADHPARCITYKRLRAPDPEPQTFKRLRAPRPTATVAGDVDVYDVPGGGGNVVGMLRAGETVPFGGCNADNWCEVTDTGWVWGDFLTPN
jgi:hypothetical protein